MTTVTEHLERLGVRFEVLPHERSETAFEVARALGIHADEVLKPFMLNVETGDAVAVVPAARRLDLRLTRTALNDLSASLASEAELKGVCPEFEPGALPAVPSPLHIPVAIDRLLRGGTVTIAPISKRGALDGARPVRLPTELSSEQG